MKWSEDIPPKRRPRDTQPSAFEGLLNKVGDITTYEKFCWLQETFRINGRKVTYWMETITIKAVYVKGGFGSGNFWKPIEVNGQPCR